MRLDNNIIGDRGAMALASALKRASDVAKFRIVNLFANHITDQGAIVLAAATRDAVHAIDELRLAANPIGQDACNKLADVGRERGTVVQLPREARSGASEDRPRFADRRLVLERGRLNEHTLIMRFIALELTDDDVARLASRMTQEVRERRATMRLATTCSLVELKVLLQQNRIGDSGVSALVASILSLRDVAWISDLRVFANCIGDVGAKAIASLFTGMAKPPAEIHISDNCVGIDGATIPSLVHAILICLRCAGAPQ